MTYSFLSEYDKKILLNRLRDINSELFYDKLTHNKVLFNKNIQADAYILIPNGYKSLLWYTYYKKDNVCILINFNDFNKIQDMKIYSSCFTTDLIINDSIFLGYQTINTSECNEIYGKYKQVFFACTDIIRYKGKNLDYVNYYDKIKLYSNIFTHDIRQISYNKYTLIFGLAIIKENYNELTLAIEGASYSVKNIEYVRLNMPKSLGFLAISSLHINHAGKNEALFKIKAELQADVYNLYFYDKGSSENFHNIAFINNYQKSVFMNGIFRNIKENSNLDLLEESDDEEEFENISDDKYVDTNKSVVMKCQYNKKFKKWEPMSIVNTNKIINRSELYNIEKNLNERIEKKY